MILTNRFAAAVLGVVLAAAACNNDQLNRPFGNTPVNALFDRYVSMGNSITAGFQSGGINDSTQLQSYAVLLAQAMHSPFFPPLPTFQTNSGLMLDSIAAVDPQGVVLIGVANLVGVADRTGLPPTQPPANGVPFFSYGSTYYVLDAAGAIPGPFTAAATCAPP